MTLCPHCRDFIQRHRKAVRWAVFLVGLSLFFFWLGSVSKPVNAPGFCRVYY